MTSEYGKGVTLSAGEETTEPEGAEPILVLKVV
jgi:hypothetical protein